MQFSNINIAPTFAPDLTFLPFAIATHLVATVTNHGNVINIVINKFIRESGSLISDVIDICDSKKLSGFIVSMDIKQACDTLDHSFLNLVLKKIGFGQNFIGLRIYLKIEN